MKKLPVFDTIGAAYRFAYLNFVRIFMLAGPPLLAAAVIGFFIQRAELDLQIAALQQSGDLLDVAAPKFLMFGIAASVVNAVFTSIAAVALHRIALFGPQAGRLALGRAEAQFMVVWLTFLVVTVFSMTLVLMLGLANPAASDNAAGIAALVFLILYVGMIVLAVRLLPIFPHIVAVGEISAVHALRLSNGNWWRIFGCFFFAFLPLPFVVAGADPLALNPNAATMKPLDLLPILTHFRETLIETSIVLYLFNVLMTAIGVALLSYIYKLLSGRGVDDLLPEPV